MRGMMAMALAFGAVTLALRKGKDRFPKLYGILPKHPYKKYGRRSLSQIKNIVIHHSAGDGQSVWDIARFHTASSHLDEGGAPAIAYHYFIEADGRAFQTNPLEAISWHAKGHNTESIGICLSGNLDNHPPSASQKASLMRLVRTLKRQFPKARVLQHKDLRATSCAGRYFDIRPYQI